MRYWMTPEEVDDDSEVNAVDEAELDVDTAEDDEDDDEDEDDEEDEDEDDSPDPDDPEAPDTGAEDE